MMQQNKYHGLPKISDKVLMRGVAKFSKCSQHDIVMKLIQVGT